MLPELDDDFALDAAGFDTLAELREDVRARLLEVDERTVEREFREAVLDAAADGATVTVPDAARSRRARRRPGSARLHALSHQGVSKEAYLRISGMTEEEVLESARPSAERALRAEAVIAAIVEAEQIEPTDEELLAVLAETVAPDERGTDARSREAARAAAQVGPPRGACARTSPSARRSTVSSRPRSRSRPERAAAREKLWTPGS